MRIRNRMHRPLRIEDVHSEQLRFIANNIARLVAII